MSREIKFRVWDKESNTFLKENYISILALFNLFDSHKESSQRAMPNTIWQQFTGLTDKNGKEIYEGDIVEAYRYDSIKTPTKWFITKTKHVKQKQFGYIEFSRGQFLLNQKFVGSFLHPMFDMEILGNILENPQLLK